MQPNIRQLHAAFPHLSAADIDALTADERRDMLDAHARAEQPPIETAKQPARSGNITRVDSPPNSAAPSGLLRGHRVAPGHALCTARGVIGPGEFIAADDFPNTEAWDTTVAAGRIVPDDSD